MDDQSGDFSEELDEFEASMDETKQKNIKNQTSYTNKPYDEAFEISQELSMAESYDGREKERKLRNDKYDEAVEISQSMDQNQNHSAMKPKGFADDKETAKGSSLGTLKKGNDQSKSQSVLNKPFDEALEFSHSGSDESAHTKKNDKNKKLGVINSDNNNKPSIQPNLQNKVPTSLTSSEQTNKKPTPAPTAASAPKTKSEESSSDGEGEHEESYDNIEGAYNPKDYQHLNVTAEVRDLFQYIDRYKPQEVELDTPLRCFIPEYIPAIGELDAFIKVPRPDGREDGLGLRYLDEPSSNQSDPTVLELQLRAKSKKLQYGDVVVRSIESADKNPAKIDRWIQDINELHRSKPPPQVNYKKNMPDIETLLEVWPSEFESILETTALPSPDLDLSLLEYAKTLCAILDIPVYDNPIESLHLMFTLFIDFRNNPHFQSRQANYSEEKNNDRGYGNADVMEIDQEYK